MALTGGPLYANEMPPEQLLVEKELAELAKKYRVRAGKSRADAARALGVARQAIIYAEDHPKRSFTKLRCRLIEAYSDYRVQGPVFFLEAKK